MIKGSHALVALSVVVCGLSDPIWAGPQTMDVRVRVRRELRTVEVSGLGLRIARPGAALNVVASEGPMHARVSYTDNDLWLVEWDGGETQTISSETLKMRGQLLRVGRHPVPYDLELIATPARKIDVIARMDLEAYLMGVLPAEMPISWPLEALKAQAVAARSFVLRNAFERRERHFDVDSTIIDQVYKFLDESEHRPSLRAKLARAVQETRGEVLLDQRQRIIKAFYSADCGCQTEDPRFVWGRASGLTSVREPAACNVRPSSTWTLTLKRSDVRATLIAGLGLPAHTSLRALNIAGLTPSGRVADLIASVRVNGQTETVNLNAQEFRRLFGFSKLRSTDFRLNWLADTLVIRGQGNGHGVGLCQTGARALAERKASYREILKHYYPEARLYSAKRT